MTETATVDDQEAVSAARGMWIELSDEQKQARQQFRGFVDEHVAPHAGRWDREERLPLEIVGELRSRGYLGAPLPVEAGGGGMDAIRYGLLTEELARGCSSVRTILTVHDMVTFAVWRWGSPYLKTQWVPRMARGEMLCAFALSEPEVGSDAKSIAAQARPDGEDYVIDAHKMWISLGLVADLFLVFARCDDQLAAFLVPASTPGLSRRPTPSVMGTRAAYIAELELAGCRVPAENLVGRVGFGFSHVAAAGLELGRYSVAWGSVGIAQACLDACLAYTAERRQFGVPLRDHQLVRRKLTEMIVNTRAARLLCYRAGTLRALGDPGATMETMIAKYHASRTAARAAGDAVQLHGANGLSDAYPVARYLRDAKVTEVIEGSTQIQQITIARYPPPEL
ncbi:MAG TPA: acyl-CoA dehydrogenase family protein [Thermoanaerobaculia bacterium]|jgi:hypothetical protein